MNQSPYNKMERNKPKGFSSLGYKKQASFSEVDRKRKKPLSGKRNSRGSTAINSLRLKNNSVNLIMKYPKHANSLAKEPIYKVMNRTRISAFQNKSVEQINKEIKQLEKSAHDRKKLASIHNQSIMNSTATTQLTSKITAKISHPQPRKSEFRSSSVNPPGRGFVQVMPQNITPQNKNSKSLNVRSKSVTVRDQKTKTSNRLFQQAQETSISNSVKDKKPKVQSRFLELNYKGKQAHTIASFKVKLAIKGQTPIVMDPITIRKSKCQNGKL